MLDTEAGNLWWFAGWLAAILMLFVAGLRLPLQTALSGWRARLRSVGAVFASAIVLFVANAALISHDMHIDLTREKVFTPSQRALDVVDHLERDVRLTWFYQAEDQNGGRIKEIVELMGKRNSHLKVRTVDPDKQPSLAETYGVRLYNAAVLEADGRRVLVTSTDENEIGVGILKALRQAAITVCFVEGHNELTIDNPTRGEDFETGIGTHDRDAESIVTLTIPRGLLHFAKALEAQGYLTKRILPATGTGIPDACSVVVSANPRTAHPQEEIAEFERYLARGGSTLLLFDVGYNIEPPLEALVAKLGVRLDPRVVVDPVSHYAADAEIVAVPTYEPHAVTRGLSLSLFPGVRAIESLPPARGIKTEPLFVSSPASYLLGEAARPGAEPPLSEKKAYLLGAAAEGVWPEGGTKPFRAVLVGDTDFASNQYFPQVSNSDLALSMVRWLSHEERLPAAKSRIPVAPTAVLTKDQMRWVFLLVGVLLPLGATGLGARAWWLRR